MCTQARDLPVEKGGPLGHAHVQGDPLPTGEPGQWPGRDFVALTWQHGHVHCFLWIAYAEVRRQAIRSSSMPSLDCQQRCTLASHMMMHATLFRLLRRQASLSQAEQTKSRDSDERWAHTCTGCRPHMFRQMAGSKHLPLQSQTYHKCNSNCACIHLPACAHACTGLWGHFLKLHRITMRLQTQSRRVLYLRLS